MSEALYYVVGAGNVLVLGCFSYFFYWLGRRDEARIFLREKERWAPK